MSRGNIVVLAAGIIAVGICAALPFQHPVVSQRQPAESADDMDELRWRGFDETMPAHTPPDRPPMVAISDDEPLSSDALHAAPPAVTRPATLPATAPSPPPQLPNAYPERASEPQSPLRHRIVDGDNLESLAEKYLGSADRHMELYDANRDVLPSPDLLPIGVEIAIPSP